MSLLGLEWKLGRWLGHAPMVHRTRVFKDRGRWWWTCLDCPHLGMGNSWSTQLAKAERHVLGRRLW